MYHPEETPVKPEGFYGSVNRQFLWLNQDFPVSKDYLQEIVDYFDSEVYSGKMDSIEMVNASNQWANEKTRGLIPQIVAPGQLTSDMVWHLMNAVYLKAAWAVPFFQGCYPPEGIPETGRFRKEDRVFVWQAESGLHRNERCRRGGAPVR